MKKISNDLILVALYKIVSSLLILIVGSSVIALTLIGCLGLILPPHDAIYMIPALAGSVMLYGACIRIQELID